MLTAEWVLRAVDDGPAAAAAPADVARHVLSRVGTAMRLHCDRYHGARVVDTNVVLGGAYRGHLVSVVAGPDRDSGALAVRVVVSGNLGAKIGVGAFLVVSPVVTLGTTLALGGSAALLGGAVFGLTAGVAAAFLAFRVVAAVETRRGASSGIVGVANGLARLLFADLEALGVSANRSRISFHALDGAEPGDALAMEPWRAAATDAVSALAA